MWIFYYSLPILKHYLPRQYFSHWALLVEGASILLCESITCDLLAHCRLVFVEFVLGMENLYGLNNVSFTV